MPELNVIDPEDHAQQAQSIYQTNHVNEPKRDHGHVCTVFGQRSKDWF